LTFSDEGAKYMMPSQNRT